MIDHSLTSSAEENGGTPRTMTCNMSSSLAAEDGTSQDTSTNTTYTLAENTTNSAGADMGNVEQYGYSFGTDFGKDFSDSPASLQENRAYAEEKAKMLYHEAIRYNAVFPQCVHDAIREGGLGRHLFITSENEASMNPITVEFKRALRIFSTNSEDGPTRDFSVRSSVVAATKTEMMSICSAASSRQRTRRTLMVMATARDLRSQKLAQTATNPLNGRFVRRRLRVWSCSRVLADGESRFLQTIYLHLGTRLPGSAARKPVKSSR